jgi:hypothetical protein
MDYNSKPQVQRHISVLTDYEFVRVGMEHLDNSNRCLILNHCHLVSHYTRLGYSTVEFYLRQGLSIINQYIESIWRFELRHNSRNSLGFLKELVDRLHPRSMYLGQLPGL